MNIKRWVGRRERDWKQLDTLLKKVEKEGLKGLKASELRQLAGLYRSVSADLARAKTHEVGNTLVQDLQRLTSRGYNQIYQGSRRQDWKAAIEFLRWGYPAVIQETWGYIGLAFAIFTLGALIAWWYAWQDPVFVSIVVPAELIKKVRDDGELWMGSIIGIEPLASSQIMINNLKVSFAAAAGGITAGIYTLYILAYNGIHIGAIATLVGQNNLAYPFWAFVFPHGSLELPAIFIAGGAGLLIGRGLLFPGQYRRVDALKIYSYKAAQLMIGVVILLIIAGTIEGFFSPNPLIPEPIKYLTGTLLLTAFIQYCLTKKIIPKS